MKIVTQAERGCKWYFAPGVNFNFGPTDAAGQNFDSSWDSLIRECIQNSLDAVLEPSKPVRVKLSFKKLPMNSYQNFFDLGKHIKACLDTFSSAETQYSPMLEYFKQLGADQTIGYLQISDYNTKGMAYDENNESCNFSAFVRGVGVHGGDQGAQGRGGSFGLGKSTIYMMSPIRTIFVSTLTNDGQRVFEGVASLTTHNMGGEKLSHIGYYDNLEGHPVTNEKNIPVRFLRKPQEDDITLPGTDIYVMGRKQDDGDVEDIVKSVLTHYWLSILRGKLVVEIADSSGVIKTVDTSNLDELMTSMFPSDVDNARNSINPRPYYNAVANVNEIDNMVCIPKKLLEIGNVQLYLSRNRDAKNDRIAFFRLPCMMIMRKSTSQLRMSISNYGVYGVFVCTNAVGDSILKKLENPAHNEWCEKHWVDPITRRTTSNAAQVMEIVRNFLKEEIENFCKKAGKESLKMLGAGKYLYSYQDMVDTTDDNSIDNPEIGILPGTEFSDSETGIRNSDSNNDIDVQRPHTINIRQGGIINESGRATLTPGGKVDVLVTPPTKKHNKTNKKNKGGSKKVTGTTSDKHASTEVVVEYKVCANKEEGQMIHHVFINTDIDVPTALIHFSSKNEDGTVDRELEITTANAGVSERMDLHGVHLQEGGNLLQLRFNDDAKHALTISVEHKL